MRKKLVDTIKKLGYLVKLQGTFPEDEKYPDLFFTYWNFDAPQIFYDDKPTQTIWGFWVYCYSNDLDLLEKKLNEAIELLRDAGFIVNGEGEDVKSDEPTHVGRLITVYYIDNKKED